VPGIIPAHIVDQIRQANEVVEVIGSYFPLKRAGANFRALCPFHKEKTPSFNVSQPKQIWHCFGCGAGGDVFTFVMKYEGLDFGAAVRRLAERAGVQIEFDSGGGGSGDVGDRSRKEQLLRLHEEVATFFQQNLRRSDAARQYLAKRKISAEVARQWRLGYSPDSWDGLVQWARGKKYGPELLETGGLALPGAERGERGHYDRFRGRLMFPICDEQGRVVGFSGRLLVDAKDQPKYVNSPETPIFQKGKILFALDKAKRAVLDEKFAIVCEGQLDTITCHEAGIANVVAPQGTALTEQHARILKRYAEEVVLMFDADAAGQNAIVRSAEPLWEAGASIRVVILPEGHDPDSFIKANGSAALRKLVTKAPSFFVYLLERLSTEYEPRSDRGRVQIAQQMAAWLVRIPNPILQAAYAQQTAVRIDVPELALRQEMKALQSRQRGRWSAAEASEEAAAPAAQPDRPSALPAEQLLLQLMLSDDRAVESASGKLDAEWLTGSSAGQLIGRIVKLNRRRKWDGPAALLSESQDEETARLVSESMLRAGWLGATGEAVRDCLAALEKCWLERQLAQLRKELVQHRLSGSKIGDLQQQVLDLRRRLDNIAALLMQKRT
jgi:DNA primase